jgi:hypothetical protein
MVYLRNEIDTTSIEIFRENETLKKAYKTLHLEIAIGVRRRKQALVGA